MGERFDMLESPSQTDGETTGVGTGDHQFDSLC